MNSVLPTPDSIVGDFGRKAEPTRQGVRALTEALCGPTTARAQSSLESWTALFRQTCGRDWPRPKARLDQLARHYGAAYDAARPQAVLFALQSWYVLLVKLLVSHAVAAVRKGTSPLTGERPEQIGPIRSLIESIESGDLFSTFGVTDPWCGEPFGWTVSAWSPSLEWAVAQAAARVLRYDPLAIIAHAAGGGDLLKPLYASLFPRAVRHALGEYYTPGWLAEHVLDQVGYHGQADARLLDPTCGSGTFLLAALRRWRENVLITLRRNEKTSRRSVMSTAGGITAPPIVGFDLHPLAVASARANYLLAIADLVEPETPIDVPVFARDAILDQREDAAFDFVVGNPPWIAWDNLPGDYREATKPQWQRYGLFSLSGNEARHGGGKKDLSMLVLYVAADRYLGPAGRLGMVITQTLFQTKGAGDGFRRFRLGADGPPLRVLRVDDLVDVRPFGDAANWTSVLVLQKGEPTVYPVKYVKWSARGEKQGAGGREQGAGGRGEEEKGRRGEEEKGRRGEEEKGRRGEGEKGRGGEGEKGRGENCDTSAGPPNSHPSSFILHPSSFIPHPSSFILHPSSLIPHPSSFIPHPSSFIPHPPSSIPHPSSFFQRELLAQPIDPACPSTPWIIQSPEAAVDISQLVGRSEYTAHLGANSGGANAVYWLAVQGRGGSGVRVCNLVGKAKRRVEPVEAEIEPDLLYPLIRWQDVDCWSARPSAHLLLAQDPQTRAGLDEARFRRDYPRTYAYLKRFEPLLAARAAYRRYQGRQPFYSMYNVGPYTLSAAKVIWRRMDRKIRAAVVELWDDPLLGPRPVIPQETCVLIACTSGDEAHYLCALLNSSLVHDLVVSHSVAGGKGFGTPSILDYLPLKKFHPANPRHCELSALSRRLHLLTAEQRTESCGLAEIDRLATAVLAE